MDNEKQKKDEREWAQIIEDSRRSNTNMMNMFAMETTHVETFTERFRNQAADSSRDLERMRNEIESAVDEVTEAKKETFAIFPIVPDEEAEPFRDANGKYSRDLLPKPADDATEFYGTDGDTVRKVSLAWYFVEQREENFTYIRKDFSELISNTEKLLGGIVGLTHVVDQMAEEGLHQNQRILYEEEFKNQARKINDLYHQINLAAFHLHGTLSKEKEVAVNIRLDAEPPQDIMRHHQAVLWAYNQYLKYRRTGNQYLISAMESLDIFMQAVRKEVMRRKVDKLHSDVKTISLERMEALKKQREEAAARKELGEDYMDEESAVELPELPSVPIIKSNEEAMPETPPLSVPESIEEESEPVAEEEKTDEDEYYEEEEGGKSIFPLIVLILILVGVGVYYFTKG